MCVYKYNTQIDNTEHNHMDMINLKDAYIHYTTTSTEMDIASTELFHRISTRHTNKTKRQFADIVTCNTRVMISGKLNKCGFIRDIFDNGNNNILCPT